MIFLLAWNEKEKQFNSGSLILGSSFVECYGLTIFFSLNRRHFASYPDADHRFVTALKTSLHLKLSYFFLNFLKSKGNL